MSEEEILIEQQHGTGYVESKKDIRDYKLNKKICYVANLPEHFEVPHSHIKNQGAVGSCVAHSVSEVLEELYGSNYSTAWIYGYRPSGYYQGQGMMTSNALKTVWKVGAVYNDDLPMNVEMPQAKELVSADLSRLKKLASDTKIAHYARLYTQTEIKEAIYKLGKPVVVCIPTENLRLDENYIAQIPQQIGIGGHAIVCFGWNELGLLIQNSWGESWGDQGCFILPYEYPIAEAWVMTTEKDVAVKPSAFVLREFIVNLASLISKFIKGLFKKN